MELRSSLNQKFDARIRLLSVNKDQMADIKVGLADAAVFDRLGVERPYVLTTLRFSVEQNGDGDSFVRITSQDYIREPYLNFIVAVDGPAGRILREYTVLLERTAS